MFLKYYLTLKGLNTLELTKFENWAKAKEQSFKRVFLPKFHLKILPVFPHLISKISEWAQHSYEPYYIEEAPMPLEGAMTSEEEIKILDAYLPTRETTLKIGNFEICFDNGQEKLLCGVQDVEFVQHVIMYAEQYIRYIFYFKKVR